MRLQILACALGAVLAALSACNPRPPVVGGCEFTYECEAGSVCREGRCEVVALPDPGSDGGTTQPTDAGPTPPRDGGTVIVDGGSPDGGMSIDAGTRLTFAPGSYRRCSDDLECAIFGGNCVVELSLSRPTDGGVDRVAISAIDPSFAAGQGICTLPCTSDPRICDSITVTSPTGASAPFSCQVVYAAQSPYPETAPAFPFDTQLDATAMARGVPFASVCRPPFQHALTHSEQFCAPCTEDLQCGSTGACFYERSAATPRSGTCVEACSASNPCQFGFTCGTLPGSSSAATYCLPSAGTCGRCRDADGDLRGVGRCGAITEPNTAVDCDDANPRAYFDAANPNHAFPAACGNTDVNCNGKSDEAEQLGGSDHCAACGDVCVGRAGDIANARRACLPRTTSNTFACVADCDPGYADCDGDISNGCEAQLGSSAIWAEDADGDGRGSMTNFRYVCTGAQPTGWVQNRLDCNDTAPAIYGGNASLAAGPELCDGLDNNCNGVVDDPGAIVDEFTACNTGLAGVCAAGTQRCQTMAATADAGATASLRCVGTLDPAVQASVPETCDGLDNNCVGGVDDGLDYYASQGQQNPHGHGAPVECPVAGGKGICAKGAYACTVVNTPLIDGGTRVSGTWTCAPNLPQSVDLIDDDGIDSNCDGTDGDLSNAIFVRPAVGNGAGERDGKDTNPGTAQLPVATINRALQLACVNAPCKDIFVASGEYESQSAIAVKTFADAGVLPDGGVFPPARIYGGFRTTVACDDVTCTTTWVRAPNETTVLRRLAPAPDTAAGFPYGQSYAAVEAAAGVGPLSLRLDGVQLEVLAPDPSEVTAGGKSAPTQIGLACPARGCGTLEFRNVQVTVASAIGGTSGVAAAGPVLGTTGTEYNGKDGCLYGEDCAGQQWQYWGGFWMVYPQADLNGVITNMRWDQMPGRPPATCPANDNANGGSSGGVARLNPDAPVGTSHLNTGLQGEPAGTGGHGGRVIANWDPPLPPTLGSPSTRPISRLVPGRGANGAGGAGAFYVGSHAFRMRLASNALSPVHSLTVDGADPGRSGGGGGGGGGCNSFQANPASYGFCAIGLGERGGGGGAGGCGGWAGHNGGDGGNSIGLLLTSGTTANTRVRISGAFRLNVGSAGRGGAGARGGIAAPGGYGGLFTYASVPEYNGAHGGDGGGGGGGVGGVGGSVVGIFRACQRGSANAGACGISLPPILTNAPGQFITLGSPGTGGAGGEGGGTTAKSVDTRGRSDEDRPRNNGGSGQPGRDGAPSELVSFSEVLP